MKVKTVGLKVKIRLTRLPKTIKQKINKQIENGNIFFFRTNYREPRVLVVLKVRIPTKNYRYNREHNVKRQLLIVGKVLNHHILLSSKTHSP